MYGVRRVHGRERSRTYHFPTRRLTVANKIQGKVVEVDVQGNLITDVGSAELSSAPRDESVRIVIDEHETYGIFPVEHGQPAMTLIAILEEGLPLRIELTGDSASAMLGVRVGALVEVHW